MNCDVRETFTVLLKSLQNSTMLQNICWLQIKSLQKSMSIGIISDLPK